MNKEDLILQELMKINGWLDKMDDRLNQMETTLETMQEDLEITRSGVNTILGWAERVSNAIRFPLPKI